MSSYLLSYVVPALLLCITVCTCIARMRHMVRLGSLCWLLLTAVWGAGLILLFIVQGSFSMSGLVPTCIIAGCLLSLLQAITYQKDVCSGSRRPLWSACFVALLVLCSVLPEPAHHNTFMLNYVFAILFFVSRPLCLGLTLFAMAGIADCLQREHDLRVAHISKDMVYLASTVFLAGEIAGSYWGFVGWGTTWRWSGNFFFSAMLFVLYMVALHIPRKFFSNQKAYLVATLLPLLWIVGSLTITKML